MSEQTRHTTQRDAAASAAEAKRAAKTACRKAALAARDAIPPERRARKSASLRTELARLVDGFFRERSSRTSLPAATCAPTPVPPTIAVYFPMRSEVNLRGFFPMAYRRGWRLAFPVMTDTGMTFYDVPVARFAEACEAFLSAPLRTMSRERMRKLGYCPVSAASIDLAICPLVAFDSDNMRLGYGGGNYDRFLPQLRADAPAIGVAFDEQRVPHVPAEPHDKPLQRIVHA